MEKVAVPVSLLKIVRCYYTEQYNKNTYVHIVKEEHARMGKYKIPLTQHTNVCEISDNYFLREESEL